MGAVWGGSDLSPKVFLSSFYYIRSIPPDQAPPTDLTVPCRPQRLVRRLHILYMSRVSLHMIDSPTLTGKIPSLQSVGLRFSCTGKEIHTVVTQTLSNDGLEGPWGRSSGLGEFRAGIVFLSLCVCCVRMFFPCMGTRSLMIIYGTVTEELQHENGLKEREKKGKCLKYRIQPRLNWVRVQPNEK